MNKTTSSVRWAWLKKAFEVSVLLVVLIVLMPLLVVLVAVGLFRLRRVRFFHYRPAIRILGMQIWNATADEAVSHVIDVMRSEISPQPVFFVNAACFNIAAVDPEYQAIMNGPGSVLVDGIGVKLAGMLTDQPVRENVNGTDLFPRICEALEQRRTHGETAGRIYLLGAREEAVQGTAAWIREHYPHVQVVGARNGYDPPEAIDEVLREIRESGADLLFVAMGVPLQEKWIAKHLSQTGVQVAMGVGGLFDFYSGRIARAPRWVRKLGFEWLYRLLQEPRRMAKRYLIGNATFLWKIFRYGKEYPGKGGAIVEDRLDEEFGVSSREEVWFVKELAGEEEVKSL